MGAVPGIMVIIELCLLQYLLLNYWCHLSSLTSYCTEYANFRSSITKLFGWDGVTTAIASYAVISVGGAWLCLQFRFFNWSLCAIVLLILTFLFFAAGGQKQSDQALIGWAVAALIIFANHYESGPSGTSYVGGRSRNAGSTAPGEGFNISCARDESPKGRDPESRNGIQGARRATARSGGAGRARQIFGHRD
jgi:hypothetical protein